MLRCLKFKLPADELHSLGGHAGSNVEGPFDKARLARYVTGDVEAGRLAFAERPHHLKALDRRAQAVLRVLETRNGRISGFSSAKAGP